MSKRLKSFVEIAEHSDFPLENLPYGIFSEKHNSQPRAGVALGEWVVDLAVLEAHGYCKQADGKLLFNQPTLNMFIESGQVNWSKVRAELQALLSANNPDLRDNQALRDQVFFKQSDVKMHMPVHISGYTDFYSSKEHATNVGCMFRDPKNALLPNWSELPVGYNGRASSVIVSGTDIVRPSGQIKLPDSERPVFSACRKLDFELETGFIVGKASQLGQPVPIENAWDHIFGMVLFNDWSARDLQAWEYQPLGPFLAKNFASTVSPWIITTEALAPFRSHWTRDKADPQPLAYLESEHNRRTGAFDIQLEVQLETKKMRDAGEPASHLSLSSFRHSYWTVAQMVAHHTVNGCNLQPGDMLGSGTQSGPTPEEAGSLLELSRGGKQSITLDNGETRTFLEDGDSVIMRGWCQKDGAIRIGFGEVVACLVAAN